MPGDTVKKPGNERADKYTNFAILRIVSVAGKNTGAAQMKIFQR